MQSFVQFLIIGLGAGATYALFAQGAVLIYRGSGLVNFAQGAIGTFAAYIAFVDLKGKHGWATLPALVVAVIAAGAVSLAFQVIVLRALRRGVDRSGHRDDRPARSPPGRRREALRRREPTGRLVPPPRGVALGGHHRAGGADLPRRHHPGRDGRALGLDPVHRVGLAISASAQNERAVQTLGWSPDRLAALTWTVGGMLGGLAAVLAAPLTGLSAVTFTIVVTVAGLGAALLGGFQSFPLTLLGGLIIGVGEAMATLYGGDITKFFHQDLITGLSRMPAFLVIFVVVVVRGRGLPLRSHVAERLPKLGSGEINVVGVIVASAITLALLFTVMNDDWASATYITLASAVMLLSIVVLTGYAGQISLAQWALAGIGALIAGRLVRADVPIELAIVLGILLTIPVGLVFAPPRVADPGVNLAVVTLGLGFLVSEVVFANPNYLGGRLDGGTRIGRVKLFGMKVDAFNHPTPGRR